MRLQSLKDPGPPCFKCALRCQRPWPKTLNRWELGHEFNDFHIKIWLVFEDARRIFDPVNVSLNILFVWLIYGCLSWWKVEVGPRRRSSSDILLAYSAQLNDIQLRMWTPRNAWLAQHDPLCHQVSFWHMRSYLINFHRLPLEHLCRTQQ